MSTTETQEKEIEIVAGEIVGVTQKKPDTWQVEVKPDGSQYTKKLWTKDSELVSSLSAKLGQHGGFVCGASYWTNNDGKQVRSLWINNEAEDGATASVQNANASPSAAPKVHAGGNDSPVDWDAKERRDYRSRAWAQTLGAFTHTISVNDKPEDVFLRLQPFQRKVYEDVTGTFAYPSDNSDVPFQ